MDLSVGPLGEDEWAAARALVHRAFVNEPYIVEMYGPSLLARWGDSWSLFGDVGAAAFDVAVGVRAGGADGVLVGVAMGTRPGHCRLCQVLVNEPRPGDRHLAIDWDFHQNVAEVHGPLGPHAWIEHVAVEPALHGLGIGRRLLDAVATELDVVPPDELVLECAPTRVGFYTSVGYEEVDKIPDPAGPDASLMRRRTG